MEMNKTERVERTTSTSKVSGYFLNSSRIEIGKAIGEKGDLKFIFPYKDMAGKVKRKTRTKYIYRVSGTLSYFVNGNMYYTFEPDKMIVVGVTKDKWNFRERIAHIQHVAAVREKLRKEKEG